MSAFKRKKLFIILTVSFVGILALFGIFELILRYDHRKDNIFQIPGTTYEYTTGNQTFYEEYYFIQRYPRDTEKLKIILTQFLEKKDIISSVSDNATHISINFMVADCHLPIWFEQNKSYFNMDDYIDNYKNNRIALYTFDCNSGEEHMYIYKDKLKKNWTTFLY